MDQMVAEYRALRASVIKKWILKNPVSRREDLEDMTRFNEAVDQTMTESISHYTKTLEHSRNTFLGILGHDLRTPLGAASMCAELMGRVGPLNDKQTKLSTQVIASVIRANEITSLLLDLARTSLGSELPVIKTSLDLEIVGRELFQELQSFHQQSELILETSGDLKGQWDRGRIAQILSNLVGNAVQYGLKYSPILIRLVSEEDGVVLSIHNEGTPIPSAKIDKIFEPLIRLDDGASQSSSDNLGLGLYITSKIVSAHGGQIRVQSSATQGTEFKVTLPKK